MKLISFHWPCWFVVTISICIGQEPCVPLSQFQSLQQQISALSSMQLVTLAVGFGSGISVGNIFSNQQAPTPTQCPQPLIVQAPACPAPTTCETTTVCPATSTCPTASSCPTASTCPPTTPCNLQDLQGQLTACQDEIARFRFCANIGNTLDCNNNSGGRCTFVNNCIPV